MELTHYSIVTFIQTHVHTQPNHGVMFTPTKGNTANYDDMDEPRTNYARSKKADTWKPM